MTDGNAPFSDEAKKFIAKAYPCEPPCDSWGACDGCCSALDFGSGYNLGYRAGLKAACDRLEKSKDWPGNHTWTTAIKFIRELMGDSNGH